MNSIRQDLPILLRHPRIFRRRLLFALVNRTWPLSSRLASAYRRTVGRGTRVVAVVGSLGKSTTTHAVSTALGHGHGRHGSFANSYPTIALRVFGIRPSTPHLVVEVGIKYRGQMAGIARMLRPDVTVVTSIASDHRRYLQTLEVKRSEKAEMVRILPASGLAVLNGDDPNVRWMAGQTQARIVTFGFDPGNVVYAEDLTLHWPHGMQFRLHAGGESRDISVRLAGRHMVYPILAAVAVGLAEGLSLDHLIPALASLPPASGRLQPVHLSNGAILLRDDGKGTAESIEAALDFLSELPAARRGVILGHISIPSGSPEAAYRHFGYRAAQIASFAIFTGDPSATNEYLTGARSNGLSRGKNFGQAGTVLEAVEAARKQIRAGDVVLLKSVHRQRLVRVPLALEGRTVGCDLIECQCSISCMHCPRLERGWGGT